MTESSKSKVKFGIQETNSTSRSASSIQQNLVELPLILPKIRNRKLMEEVVVQNKMTVMKKSMLRIY